MDIRCAGKEDTPALHKLVNSAYRGEHSKKGWTTEADLLGGQRTNELLLAKMIADPAAEILVCEDADTILGCVYLKKQNNGAYLGMLSIQPELQAQGLGSRLLTAAEQKAVEWKCNRICMTVITVRYSLIAYYQRRGYVDTGDRQPFPDDPEFGLPKQTLEFMLMEKILPV